MCFKGSTDGLYKFEFTCGRNKVLNLLYALKIPKSRLPLNSLTINRSCECGSHRGRATAAKKHNFCNNDFAVLDTLKNFLISLKIEFFLSFGLIKPLRQCLEYYWLFEIYKDSLAKSPSVLIRCIKVVGVCIGMPLLIFFNITLLHLAKLYLKDII